MPALGDLGQKRIKLFIFDRYNMLRLGISPRLHIGNKSLKRGNNQAVVIHTHCYRKPLGAKSPMELSSALSRVRPLLAVAIGGTGVSKQ